jgi:hypothetical protein
LRFHLTLSLASMLLALPSMASTLKLQITDQAGKPLPDAVATLTADAPDPAPAKPAALKEHFVDQKDETFVPLVEVVTIGETVLFRNSDKTRHHVYTFSPLSPFDFVLKPNEVSQPIRPQKPGVIPVGCNIHDFMIQYLFVTDARWAGKTDAQGTLQLVDLPAGTYTVKLWHPRLRPGASVPTQTVTVTGDQASASLRMAVMAPPRDDDHEHY